MAATPENSIAPADTSGLTCPRCRYDLTGLPEPRCPECGLAFDWAAVRAAALRRPVIAFERLRGWRRVGGFVATWLCVILLPIRFARQACQSVSTGRGLLFGGICFLLALAAVLLGAEFDVFPAWYAGGAACILLEAMLLTLLDWRNLRSPGAAFLFWLAIGGYTSAIVVTEIGDGPPALYFDDLWRVLTNGSPGFLSMPLSPFPHWLQIGSWVASLLCVLAVRLRRSGASPVSTAGLLLVAAPGLMAVHCCASWVGMYVYNLYS